jgi:hypothetical protein
MNTFVFERLSFHLQCDSNVTYTEAKMKNVCVKTYKILHYIVTVTLNGRDHMTALLKIQYCFREN